MEARKAISADQVVAAFHTAGIPLRQFTASGPATQLTWSTDKLIPAVVVSVYPDEKSARKANQGLSLNGRVVRAIGTHNVRIWVANGVPGQQRARVAHALNALRRV